MGTLSIWHWLIVLAVVILVFGTKKLRNLGGDFGATIKSFRQSMKEGETDEGARNPESVEPEELPAAVKTAGDRRKRRAPVPYG